MATEKLPWEEIKQKYPDEWVVLVDYELDGDIPTNGVVRDHGSVKKELYQRLRLINEEWFVIYTGRMRRGLVMGGLYAVDLEDADRAEG
ncbi:MAG: hypothetical protein HY815_09505 [Candidatus Riflebacteria bacterium]|nr:hypothetical protein [Candidatus Riflebacteria bacterium]